MRRILLAAESGAFSCCVITNLKEKLCYNMAILCVLYSRRAFREGRCRMTDEKIIALFQRRDEQAIRECMDAYGPYCTAVASGILSNLSDIEEAVSDTWLTAWDTIPPQQPRYLRLYLGRITRNRAVSIWRTSQAKRRGGDKVTVALEELGQCISPGSDPEESVNMQQLQRTITAFLKNEPAMRRQVFLRRYFYLEEIPSIAHRYGLKQSNVRMLLSRTRQKLQKYLTQEGYIE